MAMIMTIEIMLLMWVYIIMTVITIEISNIHFLMIFVGTYEGGLMS